MCQLSITVDAPVISTSGTDVPVQHLRVPKTYATRRYS